MAAKQQATPGECKTEKMHRGAHKAAAEEKQKVIVAQCELLPAGAPGGHSRGVSSQQTPPAHTTVGAPRGVGPPASAPQDAARHMTNPVVAKRMRARRRRRPRAACGVAARPACKDRPFRLVVFALILN
jgi:hypothetical protein